MLKEGNAFQKTLRNMSFQQTFKAATEDKQIDSKSGGEDDEEPDFEREDPTAAGQTPQEPEPPKEEAPKEPPKHLQKSQILGKKLTEYELHLYEYSAFSLSEEVDLFYCTHKQPELAQAPLDMKKLRSKTQFILEILE